MPRPSPGPGCASSIEPVACRTSSTGTSPARAPGRWSPSPVPPDGDTVTPVTTSHPYVRYRVGLERPSPDEEELVRQIIGAMESASRQVAAKHRHGLRDAHAKSHGILAGELRIEPDLPEHLAQGLFAAPRSYPVIVRFSTSPGDLRSDRVPALRGMAIKVIGVDGLRPIDNGATTQDFLLVNQPTLPFGTVGEYAKLQKLQKLQKMLEREPRQSDLYQRVVRLAARVAAQVLTRLGTRSRRLSRVWPRRTTRSSGRPSTRWPPFATATTSPRSRPPPDPRTCERSWAGRWTGAGNSALHDLVTDFFRRHSAEYELRAQLCVDVDRMPIEDASVLWPEELSPHQRVAVLHLPAQDPYSDARRRYADDVLSFSPWNTLEAHRPLGSIMRSRRVAYPRSSGFRHTVNGVQEREPSSIDELPA